MLIRIGIFAKCELALKTFLNLKIHLLPYVVRAKKEPVTTLLKTGTEHLPAVLATWVFTSQGICVRKIFLSGHG